MLVILVILLVCVINYMRYKFELLFGMFMWYDKLVTWYRSRADRGYFSLGIITIVFPLMTAGANRDTKPSRGYSSGQEIPITPTGSWILTVAPYNVVSCNNNKG